VEEEGRGKSRGDKGNGREGQMQEKIVLKCIILGL